MRVEPTLAEAIERGSTLPADWYTDPGVLAHEHERIFRRAWQYVSPLERVSRPGDFVTARLGEVPVVVCRDERGTLRAFANVCRHRGAEVVLDACGNRRSLQCHYHAWTYGLDGRLRAAPRANEQDGFDKSELSLHALPVEAWGPFVFVNPDPDAAAFADALGELPRLVAAAGLELERLRPRDHAEYEIAANWKVVVDNYLECYHCPVAHPSFTDLIDLDDYELVEYPTFSIQQGRLREDAKRGVPYTVRPGVDAGFYAFLWPNFTLNVYPGPGNVSVNLFVPLGEHRTRARFEYFFVDEVRDEDVREFVDFIDVVQREDTVLCESVQRGLRSGFFDQGQLMLSREHGLRHFARLVCRSLVDGGSSGARASPTR
ncbi:MAG: Rieske 2Fe-2S domain-containing protein [Actinomycetota bacterium]|nr:Rieske 2Fe-2S domain-containing protein [Actinomycetota bacterium]